MDTFSPCACDGHHVNSPLSGESGPEHCILLDTGLHTKVIEHSKHVIQNPFPFSSIFSILIYSLWERETNNNVLTTVCGCAVSLKTDQKWHRALIRAETIPVSFTTMLLEPSSEVGMKSCLENMCLKIQ